MDATFVYVLEVGCCDDRNIRGVYATAKAAMAAHAPEPKGDVYSYEWMGPYADGWYRFGAAREDHATIHRVEVRS